MISIKNSTQLELMRRSGHYLAQLKEILFENVKVGVTGEQLNTITAEFLKKNNLGSAFKGYYGYPAHICVSVNKVLVHGIPNNIPFKEGDIVSVDMGLIYKRYYSDMAFSKIVGKDINNNQKIVDVTHKALTEAIKLLAPGVRLGTIGAKVSEVVTKANYFVADNYTGHGIGTKMHEDPHVYNDGDPDSGIKLKPGMVICIEPMVQQTTRDNYVLKDNWTVVAMDNLPSAHFEHTIAITQTGHEVLTKIQESDI